MATLSLGGLECEILVTGAHGQAEVVPSRQRDANGQMGQVNLPRHTLPCGLPPLLPDPDEEVLEYLTRPDILGIHSIERLQRFVPHSPRPENLYSCDVFPVQSAIAVERDQTTGELIGYKEEYLESARHNAKTSLLMTRPLGPPKDDVRGGPKNYPFWPGGMDFPSADELAPDATFMGKDQFKEELLSVPPGFKEGVQFLSDKLSETDSGFSERRLSLDDLYRTVLPSFETDSDDSGSENADSVVNAANAFPEVVNKTENPTFDEVEKLLQEPKMLKISHTAPAIQQKETQWAVLVDVSKPVLDFHTRIPDMAYKWPFELDTFQKQALLHLENHDSVFVAAHTSAGKTVVAEYAIALSKRHMTKTVYTSPIKALSNQKFRDFKITFEDVGLITGDIQINQQASCLIMTTEILRSMLYGGSDIIRDLEWVIFDEVHYINDLERGVVWEEVLIMLPAHVSIVLLSATVPNTMEFADWVGHTKKRKVYVISTTKRPVPLEHFLYTGNSGKTSAAVKASDEKLSSDLFLLVDADSNFLTQNYNKAVLAKKNPGQKDAKNVNQQSHHTAQRGVREGYSAQQVKNIWLSVIDMLRKKDKLPAVAFIFSKKRIDENCYSLGSVDLTTSSEKSAIHLFFQKCLNRLKEPDRALPQVIFMQELLKRGLAMHHSGILPILKEIVELLFQKGLIKLLFATETFAMGVNMPARTVIFDSLRKHDGNSFRDLLPGEYIQMAGRAGRRGLDSTGTVIILCKAEVPELSDLHKMLTGKPTQLESRFRLTYSMILSLLRVQHLQVQDMLRRSFGESSSQRDMSKHEKTLVSLKQQLADCRLPDCYYCSKDMKSYCLLCQEHQGLKCLLQKSISGHPQYVKALTSGRLVVLRVTIAGCRRSTLAVTLASSCPAKGERTYACLIISDGHLTDKDWKDALGSICIAPGSSPLEAVRDISSLDFSWLRSMADVPVGRTKRTPTAGAVVIENVGAESFAYVSQRTLRLNGDEILEDYKRRLMPKYRDEPAGQAFMAAVQELRRMLEMVLESSSSTVAGISAVLPEYDAVRDLGMHCMEYVDRFKRLQSLQSRLCSSLCLGCPSFDEHFDLVRHQLELEAEESRIRFLLSEDSLRLLPEYQQRLSVLQQLQYLDATNALQLKGRVACYINQQEVLITELLFENVLSNLHHTEIAALLSCFVFEQKNCSEPDLVPSLAKGMELIKQVATKVGKVQKECGLQIAVDDYVDELHFGLVEVVFEWARGMPFSDITRLTDVQEGLIVRCIQRLDETLRDVKAAAHVVGDPVLVQKMEDASKAIKRDIVFAASLYTQ